MNPYALVIFVAFVFVMAALFLGGALDHNHESCQPETDQQYVVPPLGGIPVDREFTDPEVGTVPARQGPPRGPSPSEPLRSSRPSVESDSDSDDCLRINHAHIEPLE